MIIPETQSTSDTTISVSFNETRSKLKMSYEKGDRVPRIIICDVSNKTGDSMFYIHMDIPKIELNRVEESADLDLFIEAEMIGFELLTSMVDDGEWIGEIEHIGFLEGSAHYRIRCIANV